MGDIARIARQALFDIAAFEARHDARLGIVERFGMTALRQRIHGLARVFDIDVLPAFPQGRQAQAQDSQAVIQVLPKTAARRQFHDPMIAQALTQAPVVHFDESGLRG